MLNFNFKAEDFDLQELLDQVDSKQLSHEKIKIEIVKSEVAKDGQRPYWEEILSVITVANVSKSILVGTISFFIRKGLAKVEDLAFSEPHILVRFSNGGKRKILKDKGEKAIAEELIDLVSKGDVISIEFKS